MLYSLYVARKSARLEQKDVAKEIGIHPVTYSRKERGVTDFTVAEALKLSDLFEQSVEDLFKEVK